jgi:hypothetical protein
MKSTGLERCEKLKNPQYSVRSMAEAAPVV